jgi:hypothetical protein
MRGVLKATLSAALFVSTGWLAYASEVKTDFDKHANFSRIHTYSWGQVSTSNPCLWTG